MSGTLIISENPRIVWGASGGTFTAILELVVDELDTDNQLLVDRLRKAVAHFPHANISDLDQASFMRLFDAAVRAQQKIINTPVSNPLWRFGIKSLSELIVLLYLDERCANRKYADPGRIVLGKDVVWEQPGWVYELVSLGLLQGALLDRNEALARFWQEARSQLVCDLSALESTQLELLGRRIEGLYYGYGDGVSTGITSAFTEKLYPAARELCEAFKRVYLEFMPADEFDLLDK